MFILGNAWELHNDVGHKQFTNRYDIGKCRRFQSIYPINWKLIIFYGWLMD